MATNAFIKLSDELQRCAAKILALNPHADVPSDLQSAKQMLGGLRDQVARYGGIYTVPVNRAPVKKC